MAKHVLLLSLPLLFFLVACEADEAPDPPPNAAEEEIEDPVPFREDGSLTFFRDGEEEELAISIEIADTDSLRERGLMDRESLPEMSGMLFVFDEMDERSFWMADTPLSLDLLFIDDAGEIINIHKYARPYSAQQIRSEGPAQYVLEVPAGFTDRHNIAETDTIEWSRD